MVRDIGFFAALIGLVCGVWWLYGFGWGLIVGASIVLGVCLLGFWMTRKEG